MVDSIKKWLIGKLLEILWRLFGKLGKYIELWVNDASTAGLTGREAWTYVVERAKKEFPDLGEWLLNLLIEVTVGKKEAQARKLLKKLKFPKDIKDIF